MERDIVALKAEQVARPAVHTNLEPFSRIHAEDKEFQVGVLRLRDRSKRHVRRCRPILLIYERLTRHGCLYNVRIFRTLCVKYAFGYDRIIAEILVTRIFRYPLYRDHGIFANGQAIYAVYGVQNAFVRLHGDHALIVIAEQAHGKFHFRTLSEYDLIVFVETQRIHTHFVSRTACDRHLRRLVFGIRITVHLGDIDRVSARKRHFDLRKIVHVLTFCPTVYDHLHIAVFFYERDLMPFGIVDCKHVRRADVCRHPCAGRTLYVQHRFFVRQQIECVKSDRSEIGKRVRIHLLNVFGLFRVGYFRHLVSGGLFAHFRIGRRNVIGIRHCEQLGHVINCIVMQEFQFAQVFLKRKLRHFAVDDQHVLVAVFLYYEFMPNLAAFDLFQRLTRFCGLRDDPAVCRFYVKLNVRIRRKAKIRQGVSTRLPRHFVPVNVFGFFAGIPFRDLLARFQRCVRVGSDNFIFDFHGNVIGIRYRKYFGKFVRTVVHKQGKIAQSAACDGVHGVPVVFGDLHVVNVKLIYRRFIYGFFFQSHLMPHVVGNMEPFARGIGDRIDVNVFTRRVLQYEPYVVPRRFHEEYKRLIRLQFRARQGCDAVSRFIHVRRRADRMRNISIRRVCLRQQRRFRDLFVFDQVFNGNGNIVACRIAISAVDRLHDFPVDLYDRRAQRIRLIQSNGKSDRRSFFYRCINAVHGITRSAQSADRYVFFHRNFRRGRARRRVA